MSSVPCPTIAGDGSAAMIGPVNLTRAASLPRRVLAFLAAVLAALLAVAVGLAGGGPASAATTSAAQTRVGASTSADAVVVGPSASITAGQRLGNSPPRAGIVVATGVAAEAGGDALNAAGRAYPKVLDPRTGDPIPAPPSGLSGVPVGDRVPWGAQQRGAYIKEWYDQGYSTPEGGWSNYDIHHVTPREYGGTNDFNNLVPVERTVHQQEFNPWWMNYGG